MTRTALLFPPGGAHWPGMGAELGAPEPYDAWLLRAEERLTSTGVAAGALRRLMTGEGQAARRLVEDRWRWYGDFPLSVAAQTALGCCLADAFIETHGLPNAVVGESMGECAALSAAGALSFEDAVLLAHSWARALAEASDRLDLRMAVVEGLTAAELSEVAKPLGAVIVVEESPTLFVVSLPRYQLGELQSALASWSPARPRLELDASGPPGAKATRTEPASEEPSPVRMLVSANHCVAHDPRLRAAADVWERYANVVRALAVEPPRVPLWSTLQPEHRLSSAGEVRAELLATSFTPVRWRHAITHLTAIGIEQLVLVGMPTRSYVLDKLRREEPRLADVSVRTLRDLRSARSERMAR